MASSQALEAEVMQMEQQIAPLITQLDAKLKAVAPALCAAAADWVQNATQNQVKQHAAKVTAAGPEGMRALKADLAELVAVLHNECARAMASTAEWPHNQILNPHVEKPKKAGESYFSIIFRTVISGLGSVLDQHGILRASDGHKSYWERSGYGGAYRYAINPGFDPQSTQEVKDYDALLVPLQSAVEALKLKREELLKAKAQELWDAT